MNKSSKYFKNKKTKMLILPLLHVMGQNGPQVFLQCFYLIIPKQNVFISVQCLGPFYSYGCLNFDGIIGLQVLYSCPPLS